MRISKTDIDGLLIIEPKVFTDERGFFYESFNKRILEAVTQKDEEFVQDNHSFSNKNVLRGLHIQKEPYTQVKIVRVVEGEVLDVVVDVRKNSKTFGKHFKIVLSAENRKQLYIPKGFAHGFLVLSETAEFVYKCSDFYHPESETGLAFDDPELGIDWEIPKEDMVISEKDRTLRQVKLQDLEFYV